MGIYVGAGGVKTVNSLYVGAGGVKTVTAVYVGAGGTYKVWPDLYSLEENGLLETYGYYNNSVTGGTTGTKSNTDRQTAGASQTYTSRNSNHWFSTNTKIDLTSWNYVVYGYYAEFTSSPPSSGYNYESGVVQLTDSIGKDSLVYHATDDGAYECVTSYGAYFIRSGWTTNLTGSSGYVFVICDISACEQTSVYLGCGIMMGISGTPYRYHYQRLLDGYGPYLTTSYPSLSPPTGDCVSFSMTMTSAVNTYTIG